MKKALVCLGLKLIVLPFLQLACAKVCYKHTCNIASTVYEQHADNACPGAGSVCCSGRSWHVPRYRISSYISTMDQQYSITIMYRHCMLDAWAADGMCQGDSY